MSDSTPRCKDREVCVRWLFGKSDEGCQRQDTTQRSLTRMVVVGNHRERLPEGDQAWFKLFDHSTCTEPEAGDDRFNVSPTATLRLMMFLLQAMEGVFAEDTLSPLS